MQRSSNSPPPNLDEITSWVSSVLAEINVGLLIYHLEEPGDPMSLRLVYANRAASDFTGTDLGQLVGMRILEAFPALAETGLPAAYLDAIESQRSLELGTTEYGDENVEQGFYSVKAFPMPSDCAGVIFENITVRKKVEELVKKERERKK